MRGGGGFRGIALPAVLFALVSLGLLASGLFFVAVQELRSGRNALSAVQALAAAEGAADSIVSHWNGAVYNLIPVGGRLELRLAHLGEAGGATATLTRTGDNYFLIQVEAAVGEARQVSALIVRLERSPCLVVTAVSCSPTTGSMAPGRATQLTERGWVGAF